MSAGGPRTGAGPGLPETDPPPALCKGGVRRVKTRPAPPRDEHYMPQEVDERLTQKERILLPKEKYFDTSIQEMETIRLEETSYEELRHKTAQNEEIQTIRKALE